MVLQQKLVGFGGKRAAPSVSGILKRQAWCSGRLHWLILLQLKILSDSSRP